MFKKVKSFGARVAAAGAGVIGLAGSAMADNAALLTATQTAVEAAGSDAMTVGGYVVAGVASLIVIGLIIGVVHKLR